MGFAGTVGALGKLPCIYAGCIGPVVRAPGRNERRGRVNNYLGLMTGFWAGHGGGPGSTMGGIGGVMRSTGTVGVLGELPYAYAG